MVTITTKPFKPSCCPLIGGNRPQESDYYIAHRDGFNYRFEWSDDIASYKCDNNDCSDGNCKIPASGLQDITVGTYYNGLMPTMDVLIYSAATDDFERCLYNSDRNCYFYENDGASYCLLSYSIDSNEDIKINFLENSDQIDRKIQICFRYTVCDVSSETCCIFCQQKPNSSSSLGGQCCTGLVDQLPPINCGESIENVDAKARII